MMRPKVAHRLGPAHHLSSRVEHGSSPAKRFDGEEARGDAGDQLAGSRRRRKTDAGLDEEPVPGDRGIADPPGNLEGQTAGRTARREFAVPGSAQDPDGVVAEGRRPRRRIPGTEEPAGGRATEPRIDRTQSNIPGARWIRGGSRIPITPGDEGRPRFRGLQIRAIEAMGVREVIRVLATQQTMLRAVHDQPGDGHRMKMAAKTADTAESEW